MFVANLTTYQYIECDSETILNANLRELLQPNTKKTAIFKCDVGKSHWIKTDKIVYVPDQLVYFVQNYGKLYM